MFTLSCQEKLCLLTYVLWVKEVLTAVGRTVGSAFAHLRYRCDRLFTDYTQVIPISYVKWVVYGFSSICALKVLSLFSFSLSNRNLISYGGGRLVC